MGAMTVHGEETKAKHTGNIKGSSENLALRNRIDEQQEGMNQEWLLSCRGIVMAAKGDDEHRVCSVEQWT